MHNNTLSDIKKSLKDIKLKKGSSCFLHTSIIQIGFIQDVSINDIPKKVFDLIFKGALLLLELIIAPINFNGSMILFIGLLLSE